MSLIAIGVGVAGVAASAAVTYSFAIKGQPGPTECSERCAGGEYSLG